MLDVPRKRWPLDTANWGLANKNSFHYTILAFAESDSVNNHASVRVESIN